MKTEAVIFDCDGTLVDSERVGNEVLVNYVSEFGLEMTLDEAVNRYRGGKMADTVCDLEGLLGGKLPDHFVTEFRLRSAEAYRKKLKPIPGAYETLDWLKYPVAVASSAPREKIELALTVTGLRDFFGDQVFSAYEIGVWKPEPDLFFQAADSLGVSPEKCVVVEDSDHGVQAALNAGMRVYAYVASREEEAPAGAMPIYDLRELIDLI